MATTGEILWADVISRLPIGSSFGSDTLGASIEVRAGGRFQTVVSYRPLGDFAMRPFRFPVPNPRYPLSVYLFVQLIRRLETTRLVYGVRLHWDSFPTYDRSGHCWRVFPFRDHLVYFEGEVLDETEAFNHSWVRRKIYLLSSPGWQKVSPRRRSSSTGPSFSLTPRQILNLSLKSGALRGGIAFPRSSTRRVRSSKNLLSAPNPSIKNTSYFSAHESNATDYHESGPFSYESYNRSFSSVNTPGFKKLKKRQLPVNPYSMQLTETDWYRGEDRRKLTADPFFNSDWSGNSKSLHTELSATIPPFDTAVSNLAIRRLINDAQAGIDGNLAQDVAQIHQLVDMIANTVGRITGSVWNLRRGNIKGAISSLTHGKAGHPARMQRGVPSVQKSLANNWLELQYGWKPLLSDIDGALRSLANALHGPQAVLSARGSARRSSTVREVIQKAIVLPQDMGQRITALDCGCRLGVRFRPEDRFLAFMAQTGFTNPINLVWEILPWSFVVDWFLPIGPYLETLSSFHGMTFVDGFQTTFRRVTILNELSFVGIGKGSTNVQLQEKGGGVTTFVRVDRIKLNTFPLGVFPRLKSPISTAHAANALALLTQVFKKQ